jgi:ABC-type glycerol-3-phosphate transport system substrate-binding protein
MVKKVLSLLLVSALLLSLAAACNNNSGGGNSGGGNNSGGGPDREFYEFGLYTNYDWYGNLDWGGDDTSKYWNEKFNVKMNISKPDANADEKLNLMISANELPDSIWMDRGAANRRLAELGLLVDLDTLKPKMNNNWYDDNILQQTQNHLKIDGKLYGIPNWARKGATGGNNAWMYTTKVYDAVGSPAVNTFEDLYAYAVKVRDAKLTNYNGLDVIPVGFNAGADGRQFIRAIYRSFGAPYDDDWTYGRLSTGEYDVLLRDPMYQQALLEANKWYREGLIPTAAFTDSGTQFEEKLNTGRFGMVWYDHSADDGNMFRKILREGDPGNSIELFTHEVAGKTYLYLPAHGLGYDKTYGENYGTIGWNVVCITTTAKKPERIFEMFSYFLTKEGSIEMMYGPQGGKVWDSLDANGNPIIKYSPTTEEENAIGMWKWTLTSHADNVDSTKFAVNDSLPPDQRNWVVSCQAHIFSPLMNVTDEFVGIRDEIRPDTAQAINRTACEEYMTANVPLAFMAPSESEARKIIDDMLAFIDANGMNEIITIYREKYADNLEKQGGTAFTK